MTVTVRGIIKKVGIAMGLVEVIRPCIPREKNGLYLINNHWMRLDVDDSLNLKKYGVYEIPETNFVEGYVGKGSIVVDVGAHIGYYTLLCAGLASRGRVVSFEPEPTNFETLKFNASTNGFDNVEIHNNIVSNFVGPAQLYKSVINTGMHRTYPSKFCNDVSIPIDSVTLDSLIDNADFVKMDVEGTEYNVLQGMNKILSNGVIIMMEFHPPSIEEAGHSPRMLYDLMTHLDYDFYVLDKGVEKRVDYHEMLQRSKRTVGLNVICRRPVI